MPWHYIAQNKIVLARWRSCLSELLIWQLLFLMDVAALISPINFTDPPERTPKRQSLLTLTPTNKDTLGCIAIGVDVFTTSNKNKAHAIKNIPPFFAVLLTVFYCLSTMRNTYMQDDSTSTEKKIPWKGTEDNNVWKLSDILKRYFNLFVSIHTIMYCSSY